MAEEQTPKAKNKKRRKTKTSFSGLIILALRRRILLGLVTIIPIAIVLFVFFYSVDKIYDVFTPILQATINAFLEEKEHINLKDSDDLKAKGVSHLILGLRILSVFLFVSVLYIVGLLSRTFLVRKTISIGEALLERIPVIKTIYRGSKQLMETISAPAERAFREVVMIEYPRKGIWIIAFVTGRLHIHNTGELFVNLFVPTTPNPTSGFLLMLPAKDVRATNLNVEEGVKLVMSAGVLTPVELNTFPFNELGAHPITHSPDEEEDDEDCEEDDWEE